MATSKSTVDFLLDQLSGVDQVTVRKMFGDYCLYLSAKPVGLVCDDQLFLKPTSAGRNMIAQLVEGAPYPGAKPHFLISADLWENTEWFCQLLSVTANELPLPKPKKIQPKRDAIKRA